MTNRSPSTSDNKTFRVQPATGSILSSAPAAYKIRVTTGVTDPSGNPMSDNNTTGTFYTASKDNGGCL